MLRVLAIASFMATPLAAQEFFTLKGHGGPIMGIAVSPNGQIATASFDNAVGVWDDQTPRWLDGHTAAVNSVIFADETIAVSAGDDFTLRGWALDYDKSFEIGTHKGKIVDISYTPAREIFASASWDGTIGLWSVIHHMGSTTTLPFSFMPRFLQGHGQGVNAVAFTQDGDTLYSASTDGTIRTWNTQNGTERYILVKHGFGINTLVLNEEDAWLAYGAVDGGTRMIDLNTGNGIADFTLDRRPILAMAYHHASHHLAIGDGEGYISVINTQTRKFVKDFRATQRGPIWALAFSQDGQNIHAGGIDDIMYSWPVATMDEHEPMSGHPRSFLEDPATLPNGERQFKRKCSICHTLTPGSARKAGPSLHGLFGRPAGNLSDYTYSRTLDRSDIVWSAETINDLFDLGPDHYIPGSKMPMQRIAKQSDRDDLINFLRGATMNEEN